MSANDIPEWAVKRVSELTGTTPAFHDVKAMYDAFARYIASHEEAPVDPVVEAIEVALTQAYVKQDVPDCWPGSVTLRIAIMEEFAARGIELAKAGEA